MTQPKTTGKYGLKTPEQMAKHQANAAKTKRMSEGRSKAPVSVSKVQWTKPKGH